MLVTMGAELQANMVFFGHHFSHECHVFLLQHVGARTSVISNLQPPYLFLFDNVICILQWLLYKQWKETNAYVIWSV